MRASKGLCACLRPAPGTVPIRCAPACERSKYQMAMIVLGAYGLSLCLCASVQVGVGVCLCLSACVNVLLAKQTCVKMWTCVFQCLFGGGEGSLRGDIYGPENAIEYIGAAAWRAA